MPNGSANSPLQNDTKITPIRQLNPEKQQFKCPYATSSKYPSDDTPKFQTSTRPTKHIPADALTCPNSQINLVPSLHRIRHLRTSLMSRSATHPSLEAPTQQPAAASKPPPMYSPTHDYPAPTSTSTPSAYQSSPQPNISFSTHPTPQHNVQSTAIPSDPISIVSEVDYTLRQHRRRVLSTISST